MHWCEKGRSAEEASARRGGGQSHSVDYISAETTRNGVPQMMLHREIKATLCSSGAVPALVIKSGRLTAGPKKSSA